MTLGLFDGIFRTALNTAFSFALKVKFGKLWSNLKKLNF